MNKGWIEIKSIAQFLIPLLVSSQAWASRIEVYCSALENSTKLYILLDAPETNDDCDISYDDDCGRMIGQYVLQADLNHPHDMASPERSQHRYTSQFNEPAGSRLDIDEDSYSMSLPSGYYEQLRQGAAVAISIKSNIASKGSGQFQLFCKKQI